MSCAISTLSAPWRSSPIFIGSTDNSAIAPDKVPLLPGGTATFANYTSYALGINGIMVDIQNLPGTPTANDFVFKVGNNDNPGSWTRMRSFPSG